MKTSAGQSGADFVGCRTDSGSRVDSSDRFAFCIEMLTLMQPEERARRRTEAVDGSSEGYRRMEGQTCLCEWHIAALPFISRRFTSQQEECFCCKVKITLCVRARSGPLPL